MTAAMYVLLVPALFFSGWNELIPEKVYRTVGVDP